jgi:hypothetical protein
MYMCLFWGHELQLIVNFLFAAVTAYRFETNLCRKTYNDILLFLLLPPARQLEALKFKRADANTAVL